MSIIDQKTGTEKTYQEFYFDINEMINNLNDAIGKKIADTEKDFLASYKGHMEIVAKEMNKYKQLNNERLFSLRCDATIAKLQAECKYFKEESLSLKQQLDE